MITKVNKYTWVVGKNKNTTEERFAQPKIIHKETNTQIPPKREYRTKEYQEFCQSIFQNRKFVCVREFRTLVKQKIHPNTSYYIQRMKDLGLITEKHKVIRPNNL